MMNFLKRVFGVRLKAKKCGHKTKLKDKVTAFGETEILGMVPHKDGTVDYCHKCLKKNGNTMRLVRGANIYRRVCYVIYSD